MKHDVNIHTDKILILDFGAQYTQLIARRVRERSASIARSGAGITIRPRSRNSRRAASSFPADRNRRRKTPRRGRRTKCSISTRPCSASVTACRRWRCSSAARSKAGTRASSAIAAVTPTTPNRLLDGLAGEGGRLDVWMSHGDRVTAPPPGYAIVGSTDSVPIAAIANEAERRATACSSIPKSRTRSRAPRSCAASSSTSAAARPCGRPAASSRTPSRACAPKSAGTTCLLGLSGGVDSSVVAALLEKAIGDQLTCVFVDTGLLRWREGRAGDVDDGRTYGCARDPRRRRRRFYAALDGVDEPEAKRKIIGRTFIEVFDEEAHKLEGVKWLAQGTIYPDVIESAGSKTARRT